MKLQTFCIGIGLLAVGDAALATPFAYVLNNGTHEISVIDTANNTVVGSPINIPRTAPPLAPATPSNAQDLVINAARTRLYIADGDDSEIEVFDLATASAPARLAAIPLGAEGNGNPIALAFRPNNPNILYVAESSGTLVIVDTAANAGVGAVVAGSAIAIGGGAERVIFNDTGTRAYVANRGQNNISVIDATSPVPAVLATNGTIGNANTVGPLDLAFDAATNRLFIANIDDRVPAPAGGNHGNVQVFAINPGTDVATEAAGSPISGPAVLPTGSTEFRPDSVALTPDHTRVYVANTFSQNVFAFDTATLSGMPVETLDLAPAGDPHIPTFRLSDARLFVPAEQNDRVAVFDTTPNPDTQVTGSPIPVTTTRTGVAGIRRIAINEAAAALTPAGTVQFSAPTYTVAENGTNAVITVTRTGGAIGALSATVATGTSGTATAGSDFTAVSQVVNFADGSAASQTVNILITNDTAVEGNETVNLTLTAGAGTTLGTQQTATLTITDDDAAPAASGGGGGCALSPSAALDFSLPLMLLAGLLYIFRRRVGKLGK